MTTTDSRALPPPPPQLLNNASLFLDLDGTLIDIAPRPDAVSVDDRLFGLLRALRHALSGRVVVVSGRASADVKALLRQTDVAVAGSHGAESPFGTPAAHPFVDEPPAHVTQQLQALAKQHPGVLVEVKPFGLAIHYRLAPSAAAECHTLATRIAATEGFALQPGKLVIELKFHSATKGDAVRAAMAAEPMRHGTPLFIGDDLTDEAGFIAARELGGAGILVGPPRATAAAYRLDDVNTAVDWLERSVTQHDA